MTSPVKIFKIWVFRCICSLDQNFWSFCQYPDLPIEFCDIYCSGHLYFGMWTPNWRSKKNMFKPVYNGPRESFLMAPINIEIDDVMSMNHDFWNFKSNLQMLVLTTMSAKYTHKLQRRISDWFFKNKVFERNFFTGRLSLMRSYPKHSSRNSPSN